MSLQIDYDKVPYNLRATHELINFKDFIEHYAQKVAEMPSHTKDAQNRKEINEKTVKNLRIQYKAFSDMLWENIHLIESIVKNDEVMLEKLRMQYEQCRNNTDTLRES